MLATDDLDAAIAQETVYQDKRVSHYWDAERTFGRLISQTLKLSAPIAWDVYLLYLHGVTRKGEGMPSPDFWMHQIDERSDLLLDPDRLMAEVRKAIEATSTGDYFHD